MSEPKVVLRTKTQLLKDIAELHGTCNGLVAQRDEQRKARDQADAKVVQVTKQFDDLKTRLAAAESENARMRGYIARVQEDDVVREEMLTVGDPEGEQHMVPKRKPALFREPSGFTDFSERENIYAGMTSSRFDSDRPKPKHWVTY